MKTLKMIWNKLKRISTESAITGFLLVSIVVGWGLPFYAIENMKTY